MIDQKIQQIKYRLLLAGVETSEIEFITSSIIQKVQSRLSEILSGGVSMASQEAEAMKAKGFIGEISVKQSSLGFEISTDSGNLNYSSPPFPMLDKLLAKGKTAKDGSIYRVIPVGKPSQQGNLMVKDIGYGLESAGRIRPKGSMTDAVADIAMTFNSNARKSVKMSDYPEASTQVFRTASSKQDASSKWVIPERKADMTATISSINANMAGEISNAIDQAISEAESEIQNVLYHARNSSL